MNLIQGGEALWGIWVCMTLSCLCQRQSGEVRGDIKAFCEVEMGYFRKSHTHSSQVNEEVISAFVGTDMAALKFRLHFNPQNFRCALPEIPELYTLQKNVCLSVCVSV